MSTPEFIFLNGQAARVTSLIPDENTGGFTLVVIARGGADRDQLVALLHAEDLAVRLDQGLTRAMRTSGVEIRSVGDGPQAIHRIQAVLVPQDASFPEPSPSEPADDDSRTPVERRLDHIIELLTEIRDRS